MKLAARLAQDRAVGELGAVRLCYRCAGDGHCKSTELPERARLAGGSVARNNYQHRLLVLIMRELQQNIIFGGFRV